MSDKSDRMEAELEVLTRRRAAIREDLTKFAVELSAATHVVLLMHLAVIDNDIRELKEELESLGFEDFMKRAWGDG